MCLNLTGLTKRIICAGNNTSDSDKWQCKVEKVQVQIQNNIEFTVLSLQAPRSSAHPVISLSSSNEVPSAGSEIAVIDPPPMDMGASGWTLPSFRNRFVRAII